MNIENSSKNIIEGEKGIASGEISPRDRLQNQIRLATEIFGRLNGFVDLENEEKRNEIMDFWVNEDFSRIYREGFEENEAFKKHPRLKGNIFNITAEDLIYLKKNGELPK